MANNWSDLLNKFNQYQGKLKTVVLKILAVEAEISKDKNFAAEGRPKWKPKKRKDGNATLLRTGKLQQRTTATVDFEKGQVIIGNDLVYGRIHQEGGVISRTGYDIVIPARPYMKFAEEDYSRIAATIAQAVKRVNP
ncbi:MAG: phage virion morphogenesis protein [Ignavibacteria bacterium]|nr:phage virion morphogenesis protein [Ignavibacteria bacterium]